MAEFVKLPGSDSVYKVEGSTYTPIGTPQAYAQATGQNPNGPINWSAVKTVGANYLQGKSAQTTFQATPTPATTPAPAAPTPAPTAAPVTVPTFNQPTIDLTGIYNNLYSNSGIKESQTSYDALSKQLTDRQTALNDATAKINDNPFYSESTRVGRVAKLNDIAQKDMTNLVNQQKTIQDKIATQKADVETQLNLQTKQFDINSQQAQQAFNQFNALLSAGALDGASGEDIANITRSTGLSSSMIQSAIDANNKKSNPVSVSQVVDNNGNVTFIALDSKGNVVNKQTIQGAGPTATSSGATASQTKASESQQNTSNLIGDIKGKITLRELVAYYGQVLPIDDIYRLYNTYSPYGQAKESLADVKQGKFVS